jgi:GNAT superfamily N-acetyltransferase
MEVETEQVVIAQAHPTDIDEVLDILEDAARWLVSRGIDQWRPGSFDRHAFAARIERGEVYLALVGDQPAGTLTLQTSDPLFWPDAPDDALYLHKLAVRRAYAGQGLGYRLLQWAERTTAAAGKTYLRLDCMAESTAMRAYYEDAGFNYRGDLSGRTWSASLYEKRVDGR